MRVWALSKSLQKDYDKKTQFKIHDCVNFKHVKKQWKKLDVYYMIQVDQSLRVSDNLIMSSSIFDPLVKNNFTPLMITINIIIFEGSIQK